MPSKKMRGDVEVTTRVVSDMGYSVNNSTCGISERLSHRILPEMF